MATATTARSDRLLRQLAVVLVVVATVLNVAGLVLTALAGQALWPNAMANLGIHLFAIVGALIALRRPRHPIAWLCLAIGAAFSIDGGLWGVAFYGFAYPGTVPSPEFAAVVGDAFVMPGLFLVATLLLLLFPDGRLPSPRWRWLAWGTGLLIVMMVPVNLFVPETSGWGRPDVVNPMAHEALAAIDVAYIAMFACVGASVTAMVLRLRRSTGIERLQLRWLVTAGVAATVLWLCAVFLVEPLWGDDAAVVVTVGAFMLIPAAIGAAVLRYRLFDIDRLVSRSLTYALLAGMLAAVYAGGVLTLRGLLPVESEVAVAASTLAVAALFMPLRRRVRAWMDRRFNRSRYSAEQELHRFTGRLRDGIDLDELAGNLRSIVAETMQPHHVEVWLPDRPQEAGQVGGESTRSSR